MLNGTKTDFGLCQLGLLENGRFEKMYAQAKVLDPAAKVKLDNRIRNEL